MSEQLGKRRQLAREARRALSVYLSFLEPHVREDYTPEQITARRQICLSDTQNALEELRELNDEIEGT
jgi:hypothetical protein